MSYIRSIRGILGDFSKMIKNALDNLSRQMAFNLSRENGIIGTVKIQADVCP
jgi:hypothetical protein